MAYKRKKKNSKSCAVKNGVNMANSSKKSKNDAEKKQQFMNENDYRLRLQEMMFSPEYIVEKFFRKDGPPLGDEFDSLPSRAFRCCEEGVCAYPFLSSFFFFVFCIYLCSFCNFIVRNWRLSEVGCCE